MRRVLLQHRSLIEIARNRGISKQALSHRFLTELARQFKRARNTRGRWGSSILIVDGLWFRFKGQPWVIYLMALRPVNSNVATFMDPFVLPGRESASGWIRALGTIPLIRRSRVRAIVVDDFAGCTTIAKQNQWVIQLCHFHMLARLRARLGHRRPRGVSLRPLRQQAYQLVRTALYTDDAGELAAALKELRSRYIDSELPWKYRNILRQFVRRIQAYRAYRTHPHLNLPKTTGSAESMGRVIRDLMRRTRNVSTPKALELWVKNYIRLRPQIQCNSSQLSTN